MQEFFHGGDLGRSITNFSGFRAIPAGQGRRPPA